MEADLKKWIIAGVLAVGLSACGPGGRGELPADLGGRWQVQEIAGAPLGEGVDIWFEIDAQTGVMRGFTGCNEFTASMTAFTNVIAVGAANETQAECPNDAAATDEARLLAVLPIVQRHIRRGRSLELLQLASGSETLVRARLADS
jgi:heat shock protein HslJ